MPYTFTHLPPPIDKRKKSVHQTASDFTSVASTNAVASFISTNGVLNNVKKAMQAAKGGNYNLDLIKFKAAYQPPAVAVTITNSGSYDIFITKYSSSGSVNWVAKIGGGQYEEPTGVSTDSNGNITVVGYFASSTLTVYDKNGNPFATTLSNAESTDTFIAQYSSDGLVNWVARIAGTDTDVSIGGVTVDSNGNITVIGYFMSSSLTVYDKNGDPFETTLSNAGLRDIFIAQYSSVGLVNWVARIAGTDLDDPGNVTTDSNGNITVVGNFNAPSTITVYDKNGDPFETTLSNDDQRHGFVVQYTSAGLVNWVAKIGGDGVKNAQGVCTDSNRNITVTGYFNSEFLTIYDKNGDPFATTLMSTGTNNAFVAQYTSAGLVNWVARIGGTGDHRGRGISTDSDGNITVSGYFNSSSLTVYDKNGDPLETTLSNVGANDIFIAQYSSVGLVNWVARIAGTTSDIDSGVTVDSNGNITVVGYFASSTLTVYDKNGDPFATTLSNSGTNNVFVAQYTSAGLVNWVRRIGGSLNEFALGVTSDSTGNITIIGGYSSSTLTIPS